VFLHHQLGTQVISGQHCFNDFSMLSVGMRDVRRQYRNADQQIGDQGAGLADRLHQACGFGEVGVRERIGELRGVWQDVVLLERRSTLVGT
jgi:hypothetical protein